MVVKTQIPNEPQAKAIACKEIWLSMVTFKGHPTGVFYDRRYLWLIGSL